MHQEYKISPTEVISLTSHSYTVKHGKFYRTSCKIVGIEGESYCAYLGIVFLDENDKELGRRIRWINDFESVKKEYSIECKTDPRAKTARIIFRANRDGSDNAKIWIKIFDFSTVKFEELDEGIEDFEELYDYVLHWKRRKGVKKDDWSQIQQTKENYQGGAKKYLDILTNEGFKNNSKILDVGCGFGRLPYILYDFLNDDGKYFGIDLGKESIEYCQTNFKKNNFIFMGNESQIIPIKEKVEFITFNSVFTHLYPNEIIEFLKECKKHLEQNGIIIADILELNSIPEYAGTRGKMFYNREFFISLVKNAGFQIKESTKVKGEKWGAEARPYFRIDPNKK